MTRLRVIHRCTECAASHPKWSGRCPSCGAWNALVEDVEEVRASGGAARTNGRARSAAKPITEVEAAAGQPVPTGLSELDRVLGGGLVPGSVTLIGGEPGIGK